MRSNRGLVRLSQENESSAAAFYPIRVPNQSKFSDRTTETRRYGPDHPTQSYLENYPPFLFVSPTLPTHNHCITSDYGSIANPTSTHLASSSNVSQWRSVARCETNGPDLERIISYGNDSEAFFRTDFHSGIPNGFPVRKSI